MWRGFAAVFKMSYSSCLRIQFTSGYLSVGCLWVPVADGSWASGAGRAAGWALVMRMSRR